MATTTKHTNYGSVVTVLTTELNALANNTASGVSGSGSGTIFDNSTNDNLEVELQLEIAAQGSARSATAAITVYMCPSIDGGTKYADANILFSPAVASWQLDAATTARILWAGNVKVPPGKVKFFVYNATGQALAGTTNILSVIPRSISTA